MFLAGSSARGPRKKWSLSIHYATGVTCASSAAGTYVMTGVSVLFSLHGRGWLAYTEGESPDRIQLREPPAQGSKAMQMPWGWSKFGSRMVRQ